MRPPWTGKETGPERGQLISLNPQSHWIQAGSQDNLRPLTMQMKGWQLGELLLVPNRALSPENHNVSDALDSV